MKIVEEKVNEKTVPFNTVACGEVFSLIGNGYRFMKTSTIISKDYLTYNCVELASGEMKRHSVDIPVVKIPATLTVEV